MTSALFVSHTAEKGGAELFLLDLVRSGPTYWRAAFMRDGPAAEQLEADGRPPVIIRAGARMLAIRRGSSIWQIARGVWDVFVAARELAKEARTYDVLCANSQKSLFVCAIAARLSRRPLVWFLHDIITDKAFSSLNRRAAVLFANLFVSCVVVNSKETGRAFILAGGRPRKLTVVYNGFSMPDPTLPELAQAVRAHYGIGDRTIVGLFGRLSEWKGQHVLIEALAECSSDVHALIVGGPLFGQEDYETHIRSMVTRLGLENRVHFLGFREDARQLMAVCDILAHTSIAAEPFGRVVVEGMLAGRPIIATAAGGVTEIIDGQSNGLLVPPGDSTALASAIMKLIRDEAFGRRLAEAAQEDADRRFSMEAMRHGMQEVLREAKR